MKRLWLHWKDNQTGEEGWYKDEYSEYDKDDGPYLPFIWAEGNFSCDCNMFLFFVAYPKGISDARPECGEERFEILEWEWREEAECPADTQVAS